MAPLLDIDAPFAAALGTGRGLPPYTIPKLENVDQLPGALDDLLAANNRLTYKQRIAAASALAEWASRHYLATCPLYPRLVTLTSITGTDIADYVYGVAVSHTLKALQVDTPNVSGSEVFAGYEKAITAAGTDRIYEAISNHPHQDRPLTLLGAKLARALEALAKEHPPVTVDGHISEDTWTAAALGAIHHADGDTEDVIRDYIYKYVADGLRETAQTFAANP